MWRQVTGSVSHAVFSWMPGTAIPVTVEALSLCSLLHVSLWHRLWCVVNMWLQVSSHERCCLRWGHARLQTAMAAGCGRLNKVLFCMCCHGIVWVWYVAAF